MNDYFVVSILCRYRRDTWLNWLTTARERAFDASKELLKTYAERLLDRDGRSYDVIEHFDENQLCIWIDKQQSVAFNRNWFHTKRYFKRIKSYAGSWFNSESLILHLRYRAQQLFEHEVVRLAVFDSESYDSIVLNKNKTLSETKLDLLKSASNVLNNVEYLLSELDHFKVNSAKSNKIQPTINGVKAIRDSLKKMMKTWATDPDLLNEIQRLSFDKQTDAINRQTMAQVSTQIGLKSYDEWKTSTVGKISNLVGGI
jgi:hypothetical protein